ncbi:MAG: heparan-alpha-glucosaminide N-acetyltransferase domain-containing protein [Gemmatimonadota bacterium]
MSVAARALPNEDARLSASPAAGRRVASVDAIRGLVMIIMALDHVRDFIHNGAMTFQPTDLTRTTPILFFTRWITHICAPTFMFTAGLAAFFWWRRGKTKGQLSTFLLTRGVWLIVLELTVMRLAYNFDFSQEYPFFLLVLWVLGLCMMGLALLVWLPIPALAAVSVAMIFLHNTLDSVNAGQFGTLAGVWNVLHQPGAFPLGGALVFVAYPLVPWVGVMALGFAFGRIFQMERDVRGRYLIWIGSAASVGFLVLRAINGYGDPVPWQQQPSTAFTVLSFLNTTKYPPSLSFLLMTLGPMLLILAWFDAPRWKDSNPLIVFGRVPLFYFVLHFFAAHAAAAILAVVRYGRDALTFIFQPVPSMGGQSYPPQFGYDLWVAYLVWAGIVITLYPVCRWFAELKARRRAWWLSYL